MVLIFKVATLQRRHLGPLLEQRRGRMRTLTLGASVGGVDIHFQLLQRLSNT